MGEQTYRTDAPECPYCGYKQGHDGGYYYNEDLTEDECGDCGKTFDIEVYHSTSWTCTTREGQQ